MKKPIAIGAVVLITIILLTIILTIQNYPDPKPSSIASPSATPNPTVNPTQRPEPEVTFRDLNIRSTAKPTKITIQNPENKTYQTNNLVMKLNVTSVSWAISSVYYKADWLEGYHRIFTADQGFTTAVFLTVNFTEIPNGSHTVEVIENLHDGSHVSASVVFTIEP